MWFKRFKPGNFSVKDGVRFGHPVSYKIKATIEKMEQDRLISNYNIAEEQDVDHKIVLHHLR